MENLSNLAAKLFAKRKPAAPAPVVESALDVRRQLALAMADINGQISDPDDGCMFYDPTTGAVLYSVGDAAEFRTDEGRERWHFRMKQTTTYAYAEAAIRYYLGGKYAGKVTVGDEVGRPAGAERIRAAEAGAWESALADDAPAPRAKRSPAMEAVARMQPLAMPLPSTLGRHMALRTHNNRADAYNQPDP